ARAGAACCMARAMSSCTLRWMFCDCSRTVAAGSAPVAATAGPAPTPARPVAWSCFFISTPTMASARTSPSTPNTIRIASLPFDGGGRLGRDVVGHPVDAAHLVDDAARHALEQAVRQLRPVGGHEVARLYRAQRDHVIVSAAVAHHAHALHRQEHR